MEKNNAAAEGVDPPPENSSSSSSVAAGAEEQEESGWTDYLEDYFNSEIERESSFLCSSIGSCSNWDHNISDPNYDINNTNVGKVIFDVPNKKTRTQKIFEDDSLQDTATSPIHSPKVSSLFSLLF